MADETKKNEWEDDWDWDDDWEDEDDYKPEDITSYIKTEVDEKTLEKINELMIELPKKPNPMAGKVAIDERTFNFCIKAAYNSMLSAMAELHNLVYPKPKEDIYGYERIPGVPGAVAEEKDGIVKITVPLVLPHAVKKYIVEKKQKRLWINMITYACAKAKINTCFEKAVCIIKIFALNNSTRWDVDNIMHKHVIDGIREAGLIPDDNFRNLAVFLKGDQDDKNPRTEILVCDENKLNVKYGNIGLF